MTCTEALSYDYRSKSSVFRRRQASNLSDFEGCLRKAAFMWRESKRPVCWQHAKRVSFEGEAVPLNESEARRMGYRS